MRILPLIFAGAAALTAFAADPAEGRWAGTLGNPPLRSEFGLEIKRDAAGGLVAGLYLEQMHYYGLELGAVKFENGKYSAGFGIQFTVEGDVARGTLGGSQAPFELRRNAPMPAEKPVPDLPRGPGPRWQAQLCAPVWARAEVRDGVAYVGTSGGVMHAVNTRDGSLAWTFSAGRPIHGAALATADAVYFACDNGFLYRLNRADGKEVWRYDLGDAQVPRILPHLSVYDYDHSGPAPVLDDAGVLFIGSGDGSFHAVKAADGARVWRIQSTGKIRATAALSGPHVAFGTLSGLVMLVDRATGQEVWKSEGKTPVTTSPTVAGDFLISGSRGSVLRALRLSDATEAWRQTYWGSWVESTPVYGADGLGFIGTSDYRHVTCFDPRDGRVAWRTDVFGWMWGRPALSETGVFVAVGGTNPYSCRHLASVTALDRRTGAIKWRWPVAQPANTSHWGFTAAPTVAEDTLVVGGLDGNLYGFSIE
jgi:outer membrane protein assembly factor BamB